MKISIIIPSYCSASTINSCLQHVVSQNLQEYQVTVVDSSPNQEVQMVVGQYPRARLIRKQKKTPPGIARNIGTEHSEGELLLFLDADVELENEGLRKIWKYYQEGHECFCPALELRSNLHRLGALLEHFFFFHEYQEGRKESRKLNLPSTAFAIKKDLFCCTSGFNSLPRGEDTALTERLRKEGIDLYFNPKIVAYRIQTLPISVVFSKCYFAGKYLYEVRYKHLVLGKKVLLFLTLPFLALAKGLRIVLRNLRYHKTLRRAQGLLLSPCILILSIMWMCGIYTNLFKKGLPGNPESWLSNDK